MISRYIFEVYGVLREQMGEGEEGTLSQQSILDQLFHSETLEQMRELLLQYGSNVRDLIRLKNDSATIGMIQQVQKTIRERYSENLTINELAARGLPDAHIPVSALPAGDGHHHQPLSDQCPHGESQGAFNGSLQQAV